MPFAFFLVAIVLITAAIRGKHKELFDLLRDDFTGDRNFFAFILAIGLLAAIGSVEKLKPISNAFLVLVVLAVVLANGRNNLFANMAQQIKEGTA